MATYRFYAPANAASGMTLWMLGAKCRLRPICVACTRICDTFREYGSADVLVHGHRYSLKAFPSGPLLIGASGCITSAI